MRAIAYGIQAPNPHNTQAWRFEPLSDSEALVFIDERRGEHNSAKPRSRWA
jgi:hypothetical protein